MRVLKRSNLNGIIASRLALSKSDSSSERSDHAEMSPSLDSAVTTGVFSGNPESRLCKFSSEPSFLLWKKNPGGKSIRLEAGTVEMRVGPSFVCAISSSEGDLTVRDGDWHWTSADAPPAANGLVRVLEVLFEDGESTTLLLILRNLAPLRVRVASSLIWEDSLQETHN